VLNPPFLDVVVTARPSWARVKSLVLEYAKIAGNSKLRVTLVGPALSGRYGNILELMPEGILTTSHSTLRESDDLAAIALSCVDGSQSLIHQWMSSRPDCVLVIADRSETLGVSTAAALMQIPLIHLQGGEISGSIDDKVRDTNSKLADLHLTTNSVTKRHLEEIGESADLIFEVGCPSVDLVAELINNPIEISGQLTGVGAEINLDSDFGIIMFHPDTLEGKQTIDWVTSLIQVIEKSSMKWFWFWPNPDHGTNLVSKTLRRNREAGKLQNVRFIINLPPEQFITLALKSKVLIGNSSFGIREASFIGLPVINLGTRQSGRQRASNVMEIQEPNTKELELKIYRQIQAKFLSSSIYGAGNAGKLSAKIISEWLPKIKSRKVN
jgi:UDP-hydrolysing UDP-N-acetyl-D-glucosamine 2-epimerase